MVYLEILNMPQKKLQALPLHVFYDTVYLEILNMSQNKLQDLPLHGFYGTVYLEILNKSQNKLQDSPLHVFYGTVFFGDPEPCRRTSCSTCLCTSFPARFIWRS